MSTCQTSPDPPTTRRVPTTLRIDEDVMDLLRLDANKYERSVAQSIRYYLRRALDVAA